MRALYVLGIIIILLTGCTNGVEDNLIQDDTKEIVDNTNNEDSKETEGNIVHDVTISTDDVVNVHDTKNSEDEMVEDDAKKLEDEMVEDGTKNIDEENVEADTNIKKDEVFEVDNQNVVNNITQKPVLNPEGVTIEERYNPPAGYTRVEVDKDSFGQFLRNQKLKPYGEKVLYYDGREKTKKNVYDSVFDVDIGDRNLHQCADAIMLLRAEYLYGQGRYDEIHFNFVSGFKAEYSKWMEGYRIKVEGNNVSYYKAAEPSNTYETFRKYMNMVFAYAGTLSLEKELEPVDINQMEIGDVFIVGGSPGHAIIVIDLAENEEGDRVFMLAQSYMPAQQTQVLINLLDKDISPWYSLKGMTRLRTPEWAFDLDQLRRFK